MKPDKRVQFPQAAAPVDESLARAVVSLADAIAKGDSSKLGNLLNANGKPLLDQLTSDGSWDEAVAKIEGVRIVNIDDQAPPPPPSATMSTANIYLAIQQPDHAYVVGFKATRDDAGWKFEGAPSTPTTKPRASDFDAMSGMALGSNAAPSNAHTAPTGDSPGNTVIDTPNQHTPPPPADGPKKVNTPAGPVTIPGSG
jgi:hypothetical protein